ncbi:MAG: REP-associated tyrosine transposase [Bacteroidia bacterium]
MSRKYKFHNSEGLYFVSFAVIYWLDIFIRNEYKNILLDSWRFCMKNKGLEIGAYCIMTSHVHLIFRSQSAKPQDILRDMKSFTSRTIRQAIEENPQESRKEWLLWMMKHYARKYKTGTEFTFWQNHNKLIELYSNTVIQQKLDYIHLNPVEAGFVDTPEAFLYSSARDYAGQKGLLEDLLMLD